MAIGKRSSLEPFYGMLRRTRRSCARWELMPEPSGVPGHVFVIHSQLQDVTCDAALIPTDTRFSVRKRWWRDVVGLREEPEIPDDWQRSGCAQDPVNGRFWYVDVTDDGNRASADILRRRLPEVVRKVAERLESQPVRGRAQHLITMPLLGSGGGGLDPDEAVLQMRVLAKIAKEREVDIAIVVPSRTRFEALQRERAQRDAFEPTPHDADARRLGGLVQHRALSLMIGAGVSMGAGLPSWKELLKALKERMAADADVVQSEGFEQLPPLDQAELLERLMNRRFADGVAEAVSVKEGNKEFRPALGHFLLAGLRCPQVATTNYDLLYEKAVRSQGDAQHVHALPYERPEPGNPWILKLHGDVDHKDDLVLSRSSFVEYDAQRAATGAVFQAMLMISHVLFVGLSFTDDNVLRLTHEVTASRADERTAIGTALDLGPNPVKEALWDGVLKWIDVDVPADLPARHHRWARSDESAADADKRWKTAWQVRELEIFLDSVALHSIPKT